MHYEKKKQFFDRMVLTFELWKKSSQDFLGEKNLEEIVHNLKEMFVIFQTSSKTERDAHNTEIV